MIQVNDQTIGNHGTTTVLETTEEQPDADAPANVGLPNADLTGDVPAIADRKKRQVLSRSDSVSCISYGTK